MTCLDLLRLFVVNDRNKLLKRHEISICGNLYEVVVERVKKANTEEREGDMCDYFDIENTISFNEARLISIIRYKPLREKPYRLHVCFPKARYYRLHIDILETKE